MYFTENWQQLMQKLRSLLGNRLSCAHTSSQKTSGKRGYNQAELIAEALGKRVNLPVKKKLMKRKINDKTSERSESGRKAEKYSGSFYSSGKVKWREYPSYR